MKKLLLVITTVVLCIAVHARADITPVTTREEANIMRQPRTADMWFEQWSFKMTRGLINTASCWVELPRNIHNETRENPILGPMKGLFKGTGLTLVRAVAGVMDIATFGTVDDTFTVYDQYAFPYFVWQDWSMTER